MDAPAADGSEAFVTFGRGLLKVYNAAKNFGFISPVFKSEDSEGPPLPASCDEGLWFFGNHSLPSRAAPGLELTFEIWENAQGKVQARAVQVAAEPTAGQAEVQARELEIATRPRLHPNEPRVIYPSVYISDVPVEWNEAAIRKLHRQLGLNPDTIMGLKFLPFTEISLGLSANKGEKEALPVTGAVILRYLNEEAANAGVERLRGHPIQTSTGVTKHLGAKHATPPKWVVQRRQQEEEEKKQHSSRGEALLQKVTGVVARVSMSGYGVIKSAEWGEVMWRQYELPTNLRTLQFADKARFQREVEGRDEYRRLKEMEGKDVEAELYKLPDGQLRASHVRIIQPGMLTDASRPAMLEDRPGAAGPSSAPPTAPIAPSGAAFASSAGAAPVTAPVAASEQGRFEDRPPPQQGGMPPPPMPLGGGPGGAQGMPGMPGAGPGGPSVPGMPGGVGTMPGGPMPPFFDPGYQAQMMQAMQAQMQMMQGKEKKKKKDKKEKKEKKKDKKDRRRSDSSEDDAAREHDDREPKKRRIDDDDF